MKTYSVGQINNYIKNIITQDYVLKKLSITGEVSNCKYHSLGHIYFSLKDETGSIPAVMFKQDALKGLNFKLENGQNVVIDGKIGVYERDGRYQIYANSISLCGIGNLYEEFERLKNKLNEEGLFDFDNKKEIPKFPKKVGIVTARTGAAIQDIMNIAKRRNPYVQLILYPAMVQGEGASDTIVKGIETLDSMKLDTIIVGRGGGSMEDLWAFNEENVVRAIYNAKTPIISGVGHEIDITLSDYVADLRAPTPSAACELAIPDVVSSINALDSYKNNMSLGVNNKLRLYKRELDNMSNKLDLLNPKKKLDNQNQYLTDLYDKLVNSMKDKYNNIFHRYELLATRLNGLSPTAKLINGFGYIQSGDKPVTSVKDVNDGDMIEITVSDGTINAVVESSVNS